MLIDTPNGSVLKTELYFFLSFQQSLTRHAVVHDPDKRKMKLKVSWEI